MAVYDSSNIKDTRILLSQTPPNYVGENYYLKELQQKINADWRFRPNRFDIEKEDGLGTEQYKPIQVVLQSIRNDKGEVVSKDWARVVYRDIMQPVRIGERFRFSYNFNIKEPNSDKSIWIALNYHGLQETASQVICRCNGTIIGAYTDENGAVCYHEEPVIQTNKLNSPSFQFSEVAIDPRGQLTIIAQHNKYTRQWYINQRFVIGYDRVYKVSNIVKTDSETTYDPMDVGVIRVYLDFDQNSELDDFEKRIAYNGKTEKPTGQIDTGKTDKDEYIIKLLNQDGHIMNVPENLIGDFIFNPVLYKNDIAQTNDINVSCYLSGAYAAQAELSDFINLTGPIDRYYTISKIASDPGLTLNATCLCDDYAELHFTMKLNGWN